jgi:integrase
MVSGVEAVDVPDDARWSDALRYFTEKVWAPTLKAAKVVYRRFHATRHSYAAWMLSAGADVSYVADQLGHARITLTLDNLRPAHSEQPARARRQGTGRARPRLIVGPQIRP